MQGEGFVLLKQVLRELQRQDAGLLGKLAQLLLACLVEQGTTTHKTVVAVVKQHPLLRCQLAVVTMHILDTLKQLLVQSYVIGMLRQYGLHLLSQSVHLVVGLSTQQVKKHRRHTVQQVVITIRLILFTDNSIVEGGLLGVVDGLLYLLVVTTDALHEGFLIVLQTDTVERRRIVRRIIRSKKGISPLLYLFIHCSILLSACKSTNFS